MSDNFWNRNDIQFPRLLSEIRACGLYEDQMDDIACSMDLTMDQVEELFDRAEIAFDNVKALRDNRDWNA